MSTWPALVLSGFDAAAPADLVEAALLDFDVLAIAESADNIWHVHFTTADRRDAARNALSGQFPSLSLHPVDVEDEDWAARSQASLRHVRVGDVIVAPPWDIPNDEADLDDRIRGTSEVDRPAPGLRTPRQTVVVIQPSMGFGTGHHATTRLCLAAFQDIDLRGRSVLDIGTGSGVLAIAASLLGAARVIGIDNDPDAIHAAAENLALNAGARVTFQVADLRSARLTPADVVSANLTGALLVRTAHLLTSLAAAGGTLIVSGLLDDEERAVTSAFPGFDLTGRTRENDWRCLRFQASSTD